MFIGTLCITIFIYYEIIIHFLQVKIIKVDIWSPLSNTVLVEPRPREEQPGFSPSQEIPESSGENPQNAANSSLNLRSLDGDMSEGTGK